MYDNIIPQISENLPKMTPVLKILRSGDLSSDIESLLAKLDYNQCPVV